MNENDLPAFADLRRRFAPLEEGDDESALVMITSLEAALTEGHDPMRVLSYLHGLGVAVATLDDLHDGINHLPDEEELAAFRCREGVAISHASDNLWVLFTAGDRP